MKKFNSVVSCIFQNAFVDGALDLLKGASHS